MTDTEKQIKNVRLSQITEMTTAITAILVLRPDNFKLDRSMVMNIAMDIAKHTNHQLTWGVMRDATHNICRDFNIQF